MDHFVSSLFEFDTSSQLAQVIATSQQARSCAKRHRTKDGLICHYFTGTVIDQLRRSCTHNFIVVPGVWAKAIIEEFQSMVKVPLFNNNNGDFFEDGDVYNETKFLNGDLGVRFEANIGDFLQKLRKMKVGCPFKAIRFYQL